MPSHWYRSRLFWFGLPGLLGLLWIWFGNVRKATAVCWGNSHTEYCLGWEQGVVGFVINKGGPPNVGFHGYHHDLPSDWEIQIFAPALWLDDDRFGIYIGDWVLVSIYLIIWIAALIFWQRRKHRFNHKGGAWRLAAP